MTNETMVVTATVEANEAIERYNALVAARGECATGLRAANGLIVTYARAISEVAGEGWVYLVGKESAMVREERKMFDRAMGMVEGTENKALKAKCNTYWMRIKVAAGYVKSGSASTTLTIDQKTVNELKTMLNRIVNCESEDDMCPLASEAKSLLMDAFTILGGDIDTLGATA
jgi:hypothetical protein